MSRLLKFGLVTFALFVAKPAWAAQPVKFLLPEDDNLLSATSYLNFRGISAGHAGWAVADNWRRLLRHSFAGQVSRSRGRPHKKLLRPELLT